VRRPLVFASSDVCELLHHHACQHVGHTLVLVAYLAPDLHRWDPPRLATRRRRRQLHSENLRDLTVLQDAVQFGTRGHLLCRVLTQTSDPVKLACDRCIKGVRTCV
jgi:hypothetical protein